MFLSLFRADKPAPTDDFWFQPLPFGSGGARITADSAMRLSAVYACVRVLAESFAVLPFKLYRPLKGGGREEVTDHWLHRLFVKRPNRWQTPFAWCEMLQGHLGLRGNGYCRIVDGAQGDIGELVPMHPDRVTVELLDNGSWRYFFLERNGSRTPLRRDQVWHLRGLSDDGVMGMNPIEYARESIAGGLEAQRFSNRFFANDARPGGWIEHPGKFESAEAKTKFRSGWQEGQTGANRGKTAVLEGGMKYHQLDVNNRDAQFIEARQFSVSDIARIFRVPPHMIGDLTRSTNNNIEHQSLEFWANTMRPWAGRWISSIQTDLLDEDTDLRVEFDHISLLQGDANSRSIYLTRMTNGGIMVRNEARAAVGLNPLDGLDEPLTPQNMSVGADHGDESTKDDNPVQTPAPKDDAAADARLAQLVTANAERLARRAQAALAKQPAAEVFGADFAALMSETLAMPLSKAENYCRAMRAFGAVDEPENFKTFCRDMLLAEATRG